MDLIADHLEDLQQRSGLSIETIQMMGVRSVPSPLPGAESAIEFPYFNVPDYRRWKLFPPIETAKGTLKYYQLPGSTNHLYILPPIAERLYDTMPLLLAEGEKKAAKLVELGYKAIGIGGLWNWKEKANWEGIPELKEIPFLNLETVIVPDSDLWLKERVNLQ